MFSGGAEILIDIIQVMGKLHKDKEPRTKDRNFTRTRILKTKIHNFCGEE
jgi:hypothetical protein